MCHQVLPWRDVAERLMRTDLVVTRDPVCGHVAHLAERFEDVAVEHLFTVRTVAAFDQTVLHRSTGMDEAAFDAVTMSSLLEFVADQFGTIVHAQGGGLAADLNELVERTDDATCGQTRVDLDA